MGRTKHCIYPKCNSDSRYDYKDHMVGVYFVPFPKYRKYKHNQFHPSQFKCSKWLKWLQEVKVNFELNNINAGTYLCSKHFVGGKGPTEMYPDPVHNHVGLIFFICD